MSDFIFNGGSETEVALRNLNRINVILGRNGSGKSRLLRRLDESMVREPRYRVRYITPERAGVFKREGNIETNMIGHANWAANVRRANQSSDFKSMSHLYLRNAESAYLRKLQNTDARDRSFQVDCLDPISRLLSNISIEQGDPDFVFRASGGGLVDAQDLSSGESEAIALASEVLNFIATIDLEKHNVLLIDEPDVHQHPDLQARFGKYLLSQFESLPEEHQGKITICLATHSTPLVCSLAGSNKTSIGTKEFDSNEVTFKPISDQLKKVAPFFGHPLSLSFSRDPMLILEGEDDERVWQQAARSSNGRIRFFPVLAQTVTQQSDLESFSGPMLDALYEEPKAYSLRDGDGVLDALVNLGPVIRLRLLCYAIENALVTTECLTILQTDWERFQSCVRVWIANNASHKSVPLLTELISSDDRLRHRKIKEIRQLIVSITGSKKPWEVVVGQALASRIGAGVLSDDPFALVTFIGEKVAKNLLLATEHEVDEKVDVTG